MNSEGYDFTLPIGFTDESGEIQRAGRMRHVTAGDELSIQGQEKIAFNPRYRDLYLLCKVITRLGEKEVIDIEDIENLYEADFLYLQLLFHSINHEKGTRAHMSCPHCGAPHSVALQHLYKEMMFLKPSDESPSSTVADMVEGEVSDD